VAVDRSGRRHKEFSPGVGPFGESDAIRAALRVLKQDRFERYREAITKRMPDLLIPGAWALEFKVIRPYGDNGKPAEHWSENVLHPYHGNTSSLGDCLKLLESSIDARKGIVIFGYEHIPPLTSLDPAIQGFELLATHVMSVKLSSRIHVRRDGLCHPFHQAVRVFGYEVLGRSST